MKLTFLLGFLIISVIIFDRINFNNFPKIINKLKKCFCFFSQCLVGENLSVLDFIKAAAKKVFPVLSKRKISSYVCDKATGIPIKFLNIIFQMETKSVRKTMKFDSTPTPYLNELKNDIDRRLPNVYKFTFDMQYKGDNATALFMVMQDFLSNLNPPLLNGRFLHEMKIYFCKNNTNCELINRIMKEIVY